MYHTTCLLIILQNYDIQNSMALVETDMQTNEKNRKPRNKPTCMYANNLLLLLFFNFLLLFNYSCVPFLPIRPPHPSRTHHPPLPPPSPFILSMCPL